MDFTISTGEVYGSIGWLVSNVRSDAPSEVLASELASNRLRIGVSISAYEEVGWTILPLNDRDNSKAVGHLFIGKFVPDSNTGTFLDDGGVRYKLWLDKIRRRKAQGAKIYIDYTDNHLHRPNIVGDFYRQVAPLCDKFIVPSEKMADNLSRLGYRNSSLIPEPVEYGPQIPKIPSSKDVSALWFGHVTNLQFLINFLRVAPRDALPGRILLCTNHMTPEAIAALNQAVSGVSRFEFIKWSVESLKSCARSADYTLIPVDTDDLNKNGASPGRLITSLILGLPTLASSIQSYQRFSNYFIDLASDAAIDYMRAPSDLSEEIIASQRLIINEFSPSSVMKRWREVLLRK